MAVLFAFSMIALIWQGVVFARNFRESPIVGVVKATIALVFVDLIASGRSQTSRAMAKVLMPVLLR